MGALNHWSLQGKPDLGSYSLTHANDQAYVWLCELSSGSSMWVFPKIEVPQNGWFMMENPIKMDNLGGYPYFRKHPCTLWGTCLPDVVGVPPHPILSRSSAARQLAHEVLQPTESSSKWPSTLWPCKSRVCSDCKKLWSRIAMSIWEIHWQLTGAASLADGTTMGHARLQARAASFGFRGFLTQYLLGCPWYLVNGL